MSPVDPSHNDGRAVPFDTILSLLEELRLVFAIGVDQILAVEQLLARLAERGTLPEDVARLAAYIGPIVCRSREEQRAFAVRFEAWIRSLPMSGTPTADKRFNGAAERDVRGFRQRRRLWAWTSMATLLVIGGASLWSTLVPPTPIQIPGDIPMAGSATVASGAQAEIAASSPAPTSSARSEVPGAMPTVVAMKLREGIAESELLPPTSVYARAIWVRLGLTLIAVLLIGWFLRRLGARAEARRFLTREVEAPPQRLEDMHQKVDASEFEADSLKQLATVLREREISDATDLDVGQSVRATARAAGAVRQVRKPRRRLPDYLALIERSSLHDVQAALFDDWLRRLRKEDVAVDQYFFQRDARALLTAEGRAASLRHVQAATADHRVLIFADGETLLDPINRRPRAWGRRTSPLAPARDGDAESEFHWGHRERALAAAGLGVVPATAQGMTRSRRENATATITESAAASEPPLPSYVHESARRWLHPDAPKVSETVELLTHLRSYLGAEGFLWLAGCALYPQVRWQLTVGLGSLLLSRDESQCLIAHGCCTSRVCHGCALPLCPTGFGWRCSSRYRQRSFGTSAGTLLILLTKPLSPGKEQLVLELGRTRSKPLEDVWFTLLGRIRKSAPSRDPANDRVLLTWMSDRIRLQAPSTWMRRLRGAAIRAGERTPHEPPNIHDATVGLLLPPFILSALNSFGPYPMSATTFRVLGCASLVPALVSPLRWARVEYRALPAMRSRILLDCLIAIIAMPLLVGVPNWVAVGACILWVVTLAAFVRYVVSTNNRHSDSHPDWTPHSALHHLAGLVDRFMLDRLFHGYVQRPARLADATRTGTAFSAVLVGIATGGIGAPFYSALLAFRYNPRDPPLARVSLEVFLCWAPLLLGTVNAPGTTFVAFTSARVAVLGWFICWLLALAATRTLPHSKERPPPLVHVAGWKIRLMRLGRLIDRWAPDRWPTVHPLALPLLSVLAVLGASSWTPREAVRAAGTKVLQRLDWPSARTVERSTVLASVDAVELKTLTASQKAMLGASFSLDGRRIVTSSDDGIGKLWDADSGTLLATLGSPDALVGLSFSPDGGTIVAGGIFKTTFWDGKSGRPLGALSEASLAPRLSADGSKVVTFGFDVLGRIWDVPSGKLVTTLRGHTDRIRAAAFSPDGTHVVTASQDMSGRVWTVSSGELLTILAGHTGSVTAVAFSPNGQRIVTASQDKTAKLWDMSGKVLATLAGHSDWVKVASFSPDGERIVTASVDSTAKIWNGKTGQLIVTLVGHTGYLSDASFSPDGATIVTAASDGSAKLWDTRSGKLLATLRGHTNAVAAASFSSDGTRLVTASDDGTAKTWRASDFAAQDEGRLASVSAKLERAAVSALQFSGSGSQLLVSRSTRRPQLWRLDESTAVTEIELSANIATFNHGGLALAASSLDGGLLRLWPAGNPVDSSLNFSNQDTAITAIAFSSNGQYLVDGSQDGRLRVWNLKDSDRTSPRAESRGSSAVNSVAVSPFGELVVAVFRDHKAIVWEWSADGKPSIDAAPSATLEQVQDALLSPKGSVILIRTMDGSALIYGTRWRGASGDPGRALRGFEPIHLMNAAEVTSAGFAPDGALVVTGSADGNVRVWDAETGQLEATLEGAVGAVTSVAFSPEGSFVLGGSEDGRARLWKLDTGAPPVVLSGHATAVTSVAFSSDGRRVATGAKDGTARLWDLFDPLILRPPLATPLPAPESTSSPIPLPPTAPTGGSAGVSDASGHPIRRAAQAGVSSASGGLTGASTASARARAQGQGGDLVPGQLESSAISRVVNDHSGAIKRTCWDPMAGTPTTRVTVKIQIAASGEVVYVSSSDAKGYLGPCLIAQIRGWQFPESSGPTTVNLPFVFR